MRSLIDAGAGEAPVNFVQPDNVKQLLLKTGLVFCLSSPGNHKLNAILKCQMGTSVQNPISVVYLDSAKLNLSNKSL